LLETVIAGVGVLAALACLGLWLRAHRHARAAAALAAERAAALADMQRRHDQAMAEAGAVRTELQQTAALLAQRRAEAEGWRALLDAVPLPLWRRGPDLALDWCNATYAATVEAPAQKAVDAGLELASSVAPEQPRKLAQKALAEGIAASESRRFVVAGDRRVHRVTETPLLGGGLAGVSQDITEAEAARAELGRHIDAHTEVLQSLATAISIWGPDKRLILFNRAFVNLWQADEAWLASGPHFSELMERFREERKLPEVVDWAAHRRGRLDLFNSVLEARDELVHLPDGRTFRMTVQPHPFGGLLFAHHDVTDQLVLERARNTLIAVQRATLDNLYEGVAVFGGDGRLKLFNRALTNLWQVRDEHLVSQPHVGAILVGDYNSEAGEASWAWLREKILELIAERAASSGRFFRPHGGELDYASVPLPDGAVLFSFLDVSDSVRIERALRERNEALQAADQLKSEFIANVSYELRTPLNTIIGFAEILANQYFGPLNERQLEYSQGVIDSSHQLLLLINDILDLASIEAGQMTLATESFDLHAMLVGLLGLVRERARRQSLTIEFDCPADIGWLDADERRVKQVLFNLMSNALKFTPSGGVITLGAQRRPDEVTLWVQDTGVGIAEQDRWLVFDKFQKGNVGTAQHGGAGLGLALVRSFVELHGGWVELDTAPERGTTVTCHLPLKRQAASRPRLVTG